MKKIIYCGAAVAILTVCVLSYRSHRDYALLPLAERQSLRDAVASRAGGAASDSSAVSSGLDDAGEAADREAPDIGAAIGKARAEVALSRAQADAARAAASNVVGGSSFAHLASELGMPSKGDSCRYTKSDILGRNPDGSPGSGDWACHALKENLDADSMDGCMPDPKGVMSDEPASPRRIEGIDLFAGVYNGPYRYTIRRGRNGGIVVTVRIQFLGEAMTLPDNVAAVRERLRLASEYWEGQAPPDSFVRFDFREAAAGETPDFSVSLVNGPSRGPYDKEWSLDWSYITFAHEIGHMMGLVDEYDQARVTWEGEIMGKNLSAAQTRCDMTSLMCNNTSGGLPKPYDYYLILRRQFCANPEPGQTGM